MHIVLLTKITAWLLTSAIISVHVICLTKWGWFCISVSPQPDLVLSDKLVVAMPHHIARFVLWSLTRCRTCLFKLPQDTGDAIRYDPQIKSETAVRWVMPSLCAFPFTLVAPFVILPDKVPACISLHIFTFSFFSMAVGDVSQVFSVRNEQGGTNRLAKYENWMTINGHVLLSAEDNHCVRT